MISTKGRYALRLMIDIGLYSKGEYVSLKDTARREEISLKYLEQVVSLLVKAGLLQSLRGNNGGYRLTKQPKDITAGDILKAAEGTLKPVQCLMCNENTCQRQSSCSTINFWKGFDQTVSSYVDSVTLESLIEDYINKTNNNYSI